MFRSLSCSQVEWDTDPGTREVQWIKTYADTGPNEIQSITTTADDVDEVQQVQVSASVVQEVQVSSTPVVFILFRRWCWHLRLGCCGRGWALRAAIILSKLLLHQW